MKKLVAISVLLAGLAAAVFAQEESKWKFGFSTQFITDMLFVTSASGKATYSPAGGTSVTYKFGEKNKGTIIWFDNALYDDSNSPLGGGNDRILLSVSNSGENYEVYADIAFDNWHNDWGGVMDFLNHGSADWYLKGNAGIFDAMIGSHWSAQGWVSTQATWNDWYVWNTLCRFGIWRKTNGAGPWWIGGGDNFLAADTFRTWPQWGTTAAVGMGLGDNFKFTLGYNINPGYSSYGDKVQDFADAWKSKSSINGTFLLSGKPVDALTFDLFYSVIGGDANTFSRPSTSAGVYGMPDGLWTNTIGAYIGLNIVENLGLSLGYTANFNAFDAGSYIESSATGADINTQAKPVTYNAPIYSGIDLRVSYSGIDKIGLTFNNNITLASVKGEKIDGYKEKVTLNFGENGPAGEGYTGDWFHWETELKVSLGFIEGVGLTLHLGNRLGVSTDETSVSGSSNKTIATDNTFRATLGADYGVGAVKFGVGLIFQLDSKAIDYTDTPSGGSATTFKGNADVVTFGIPILVKVAF